MVQNSADRVDEEHNDEPLLNMDSQEDVADLMDLQRFTIGTAAAAVAPTLHSEQSPQVFERDSLQE